MKKVHFQHIAAYRMQNDLYMKGLFFIIRECAWPPRDVSKVSGWLCVRMLAAMTERSVTSVASEVIETAIKLDEGQREDL
jgi:hypothetical protein